MEDLSAFATAHPEFCDSKAVRVPGHAAVPSLEGARPFELTADALSAYRVDVPKDPATLPNMLKMGPEAVAFYVSFRLVPDRWGIYVREGALRAFSEGIRNDPHNEIVYFGADQALSILGKPGRERVQALSQYPDPEAHEVPISSGDVRLIQPFELRESFGDH